MYNIGLTHIGKMRGQGNDYAHTLACLPKCIFKCGCGDIKRGWGNPMVNSCVHYYTELTLRVHFSELTCTATVDM